MEKKKLDHFWSFRYKHKSSRPFWFWFHLFEYDWSDRNLIRDLRCFFSTAALIHIHHLTPSYWDIGCRVFIACVLVDVVRPRCNKNRQCAWLISCRRSLALATCWLSVHLNDKKAVFCFFLKLQSGWAVGKRVTGGWIIRKVARGYVPGIFEKHQSFNGGFSDKNGRLLELPSLLRDHSRVTEACHYKCRLDADGGFDASVDVFCNICNAVV